MYSDDLESFAELQAEVLEFVQGNYAEGDIYELPELEILGICSERFDRSWVDHDCYVKPEWFDSTFTWHQTLVRVISTTCRAEKSVAQSLLDRPDNAADILQDALIRAAEAREYSIAKALADAARRVAAGHPVGFMPEDELERYGDKQAVDAREENYPPDRGLIVEIAKLWGE